HSSCPIVQCPAFPTRRSSDLAERLRTTGRSITVDDTEVPGRRRFHTEDPHGNRLEFLADAEPEWPLADDVRVRRARADDIPALVDRKSTRLNSSPVSISDAVF